MNIRTSLLTSFCLFAGLAFGWNPVSELAPADAERLKNAGVDVGFMPVRHPDGRMEYHFVVTMNVPTKLPSASLDIHHELVGNEKRVSGASWHATKGACVANFSVDQTALAQSVVRIQTWTLNPNGVGVASGGYTLKPEAFTKHPEFNLLLRDAGKPEK